jgi:hypothetical protein
MFQVVPPPIIRSSKLYTQNRVFVEIFLLLTVIVGEFRLTHDSGKKPEKSRQIPDAVGGLELTHDKGKKQKKIDKYTMLCIQF